MRTVALLLVFLLAAPAVLAQDPSPVEPGAAGPEVALEGTSLVVRTNGEVGFRAALRGWSKVAGQGDEVEVHESRIFSWDYPHLQGIVFADLSGSAPLTDAPALEIDSAEGFVLRTRTLRPHDGMGRRDPVRVDAWQRHDETGYTAILRLDRAPRGGEGRLHHFGPAGERSELRWPMAVVFAPTARELDARMAQALLAYDGAGSREDPSEWWRVPSLCGICGQQQVPEVELDLQDRESSLLLRVRTTVEYPEHAPAVAEGMEIEGHLLTPWFSGEQGEEAWFVVPLESRLADALMAVAVSGDARVVARLTTGETREVGTVRVRLDPAFEERLYAAAEENEDLEWPNHLSAQLVSSWPNPFRESTTIEITVPQSIDEAFDLEPDVLARVEPDAPPPFGPVPNVRVKVYNVSGQLVKILEEGPRSAGRFTVGWSGQDLHGRLVASGAYYIHVEMDEWSVTRRVLLLRN